MTEDMLEEHAEVLAKLGTTSEGAELRAKMQSACLLSDMGAFKVMKPIVVEQGHIVLQVTNTGVQIFSYIRKHHSLILS